MLTLEVALFLGSRAVPEIEILFSEGFAAVWEEPWPESPKAGNSGVSTPARANTRENTQATLIDLASI